MPEYRFYEFNKDGHVIGPPALVEFADDEAAVAAAKRQLDKNPIEVWQAARRVIQLWPK